MEITITNDDIKLFERLDFDWEDGVEFGAVASDFKRPFGNSGVPDDIAEILDTVQPSWDEARLTVARLAALAELGRQAVCDNPERYVGQTVTLPYRAARDTAKQLQR